MIKRILLAVAFLPIIGGCCACRKGSPVIGNLENTLWTMVELETKPITKVVTIKFDPNSKVMSGISDCQKVYAGYHLFESDTSNIEFLQPGHFGEGCPDVPEIESLASVLSSVTTVKIDGGHLLFINSSQEIVAVFKQE